jgi:uncharacterized membrane protein
VSTVDSNKTLAGIGAILLAIGLTGVTGVIGLILLFIGLKGLADNYSEPGIYRNALNGLIFGIVGVVTAAVVIFGLWSSMFSGFMAGNFATLIPVIIGLVVGAIILFVFYLLSALYFRKVFSALAQKTGVQQFETAATLLFYGAILTIVLVGFVLIFVAWIIAAVAFFQIRTPVQQVAYQPASNPNVQQTSRYCPNCGAQADSDGLYCRRCGTRLL